MKSVYKTKTPEATIELGVQLAARLMPDSNVLLFGDLGSGKTHFTKGIAKGLGISEMVKSPTFAYVNKYDLEAGPHVYHYDLYRLEKGQDFESIGLTDTMHDPHAINIIEWADRMEGYMPKEYVRIDFRSLGDHHEISIKFEDPEMAPDELVEKFWDDWATPMHVRAHCKQVANVATQIGQALIDANILVNIDLVNTAALLHDMARVCDFNKLERDKFHEVVTDEKWNKWVDLRKQFKGMHHADVAAGALAEEGFTKTAEVVRLHNSLAILEEPEKFSYLEIAVLFYADKRVKHDEIVNLAERFRDGRERNGKYDDPKTRTMFEEVERRTHELEAQLFDALNIKPSEIN